MKTCGCKAEIKLHGQQVIGSPVEVRVVSGSTKAEQSLVNQSDVAVVGTAGVPWTFKIHAYDKVADLLALRHLSTMSGT